MNTVSQFFLKDCPQGVLQAFLPIIAANRLRENVDKYSYVASYNEIRENDFNLNIPRHVDTFEEEELVDIDAVKRNIASIEAELAEVQAKMAKYLEGLGL